MLLIIVTLIIILYLFFRKNGEELLDEAFYKVNEIEPYLEEINYANVKGETDNLIKNKDLWKNWPEKYLYANNGTWKIFPFYAFGIWIENNCALCPEIYKFLKSVPGLKLATLSKLSAGMKLKPHEGWAKHSNYVLRCHYGIDVPPSGCYVSCDGKKQYHENSKWIIFDDSKTHYAVNESDRDRLVLILDVVRPKHVKIGESTVGDSKELMEIVNYYKMNEKINKK